MNTKVWYLPYILRGFLAYSNDVNIRECECTYDTYGS